MVLDHLGCRVEVTQVPEPDFVAEDTDWHGSFALVRRGEQDLVLRYLWLTHNRSTTFHASVSIFMETLHVYVAETGLDPGRALLHEAAIVLLAMAVVAVNGCLDHAARAIRRDAHSQPGGRQRALSALLSAWSLFADQPSSAGRLSPSWNRLLWASLAFAAVTLNSVRKSVYATNAMRPTFSRMATVSELVDEEVPLGIADGILYKVLDDVEAQVAAKRKRNGKQLKEVLPRRVDCSANYTACLERLESSRGRFAVLMNQAAVQNVSREP